MYKSQFKQQRIYFHPDFSTIEKYASLYLWIIILKFAAMKTKKFSTQALLVNLNKGPHPMACHANNKIVIE